MKDAVDQTQASPLAPTQLSLVNSSRLQTLRHQTQPKSPDKDKTDHSTSREQAESAKLRLQVDRRLAEILDQLPKGKQNNLFKIRFGITLHELRQLPIEEAAQILKIRPPKR